MIPSRGTIKLVFESIAKKGGLSYRNFVIPALQSPSLLKHRINRVHRICDPLNRKMGKQMENELPGLKKRVTLNIMNTTKAITSCEDIMALDAIVTRIRDVGCLNSSVICMAMERANVLKDSSYVEGLYRDFFSQEGYSEIVVLELLQIYSRNSDYDKAYQLYFYLKETKHLSPKVLSIILKLMIKSKSSYKILLSVTNLMLKEGVYLSYLDLRSCLTLLGAHNADIVINLLRCGLPSQVDTSMMATLLCQEIRVFSKDNKEREVWKLYNCLLLLKKRSVEEQVRKEIIKSLVYHYKKNVHVECDGDDESTLRLMIKAVIMAKYGEESDLSRYVQLIRKTEKYRDIYLSELFIYYGTQEGAMLTDENMKVLKEMKIRISGIELERLSKIIVTYQNNQIKKRFLEYCLQYDDKEKAFSPALQTNLHILQK